MLVLLCRVQIHLRPTREIRCQASAEPQTNNEDEKTEESFDGDRLLLFVQGLPINNHLYYYPPTMIATKLSASSTATLRRAALVSRSLSTAASPWADYAMAPPDPIIGLNEAYQKDDYPQKVIVGVGAYRDDLGLPYVLPCVNKAEKIMLDQHLV